MGVGFGFGAADAAGGLAVVVRGASVLVAWGGGSELRAGTAVVTTGGGGGEDNLARAPRYVPANAAATSNPTATMMIVKTGEGFGAGADAAGALGADGRATFGGTAIMTGAATWGLGSARAAPGASGEGEASVGGPLCLAGRPSIEAVLEPWRMRCRS
jgi:hypothetical protein